MTSQRGSAANSPATFSGARVCRGEPLLSPSYYRYLDRLPANCLSSLEAACRLLLRVEIAVVYAVDMSEIIDQSGLDVKRERSAVFTVDSGSSGIRVINRFFPLVLTEICGSKRNSTQMAQVCMINADLNYLLYYYKKYI